MPAADQQLAEIEARARLWDALGESGGESRLYQLCLNNLMAGRPSYWSIATYHHQVAGAFADLANTDSLAAALARHADAGRPWCSSEFLLKQLRPLNQAAMVAYRAEFNKLKPSMEAAE